MRCPACNTENTPDSRFCGGCGAKLAVTEPRVAPTAKIPDDAPFPAPAAYASPSTYAQGPVSYAPPSMPPRVMPPTPSPVATPMPQPQIGRVPEASLSIPTARPRTGLVATILVIDLALAGSGGLLLAKGLAPQHVDRAPAPPTPAPVTEPAPKPQPIVTPAPPTPTPAPTPVGSAGSAGSDSLSLFGGSAAPTLEVPGSAAPPHVATHPAPAHHPASPQDPYDADHLLDNEVDYAANRAAPDFEHCLQTALREAPVHGQIRIAFTVALDGHVDHARPAQNTTGSASLAGCLVAAISTWHFENHPAHPTSFVRPFSYP